MSLTAPFVALVSFTIFISGILPATLRFSKKHRYNVLVIRLGFVLVGLLVAFALGVSVGSPGASPQLESSTEEVPIATTTSLQSNEGPRYPVIKVIDGDTLVVSMDVKSVTISLAGSDTPETVDPRKPVQCFGKEASEKAKQILTGTSVRIEMDPSQGELDKYGRLLAYVYVPADVRPEW